MATPFTPDQFVNLLRAEGVRVVTVKSWRTHNRNHKGPWGPIHGVMIHHTVSRGSAYTVSLCYDGYTQLPGPLCHGVITKDGTVHVISTGRSNHAGGGDPDVLAAVKAENYGTRPPVPNVGNDDGIDGNAHFYGFECENMGDGKDPWPDVQLDAIIRASAAIARAYRWTAKSVIGHHEWSDDKSDPRGPGDAVLMTRLRAKIAERLAHPASWSPTTPVPPTTGTPVTAPNLSTLARTTDTPLFPGTPVTLYWEHEYGDDGNEHGAGGKTVLDGGKYAAVLNLTFSSVTQGDWVEVYPVEEDASGVQTGAGRAHDVRGSFASGPRLQENVTFIGKVGQRLAFQVVNRGDDPVNLQEAWLFMQSWPA